jgi:hypothetical protein
VKPVPVRIAWPLPGSGMNRVPVMVVPVAVICSVQPNRYRVLWPESFSSRMLP